MTSRRGPRPGGDYIVVASPDYYKRFCVRGSILRMSDVFFSRMIPLAESG